MKNNRPSHSILNVVFAIASVFLLFVVGAALRLIYNQTSEQLPRERESLQRLNIDGDRR